MIERADERKIVCRFILDLSRTLTRWEPLTTGDIMETMLVLAAVVLGDLDGRPFRVSKLAEFLVIPRGTLQRRLKDLAAKGYILRTREGTYVGNVEKLNAAGTLAVLDQVIRLIRRASDDLDSAPSAPPAPLGNHPPR